MSAETIEWLRNNIKIGFTDERGPAWWAAGGDNKFADGSHFNGPVPAEEVRRLLDVKLVSVPLFTQYTDAQGERQVLELKDRQGIMRLETEEVLGIFKAGYKIHQFDDWTAGLIEKIAQANLAAGGTVKDGEIGVASVALLRKGAVAFVQAKLPKTFEVAGYGYTPFVTAYTSADGSLASGQFAGIDAAVCDNTFETARGNAVVSTKKKHTKNSLTAEGVANIRFDLGLMEQVAEDFSNSAQRLLDVEVSDTDFRLWAEEFSKPRTEPGTKIGAARANTLADAKVDELMRLWNKDEKVAPWAGTAFGVVQAANTWRTWTQPVRGQNRLEKNLLAGITGTGAVEDQKALDLLTEVQSRKLVLA